MTRQETINERLDTVILASSSLVRHLVYLEQARARMNRHGLKAYEKGILKDTAIDLQELLAGLHADAKAIEHTLTLNQNEL